MTEREYEFINDIMDSIYKENKGRIAIQGLAEAIMIMIDELYDRLEEE